MKYLVLVLLFTLSMPLASQTLSVKPQPAPVREEIYNDLEEMPVFPGGPQAMQEYIDEHLAKPSKLRGVCRSRRLIAGFVVEKDGSLSKVDIIKSIDGCPDFDFDVIRVIRSMPRWIPGKIKGRNVRCYYKMPVYVG